jgi:hypothetical protein
MDEDGVYEPRLFNDRLLLGLKGAMSEAEQYVIRARLQGGLLNKARRGELKIALPVGLVYDSLNRVALDPDRQVQEVFRYFFKTFRELLSANTTVKRFRKEGIRFPRRPRTMPGRGELFWVKPTLGMALQILHNPRYAGAFAYGRRRSHRRADGTHATVAVAQEEWSVLLPGTHEGYLSWEQYLANQRILRENCNSSADSRRGRPREGAALLQGITVCGLCGSGMSPRYYTCRGDKVSHSYVCNGRAVRYEEKSCPSLAGTTVDLAIAELLLEMVTPLTLEAALIVQSKLKSKLESADKLRRLQVERVQQEVELSRRRYMQVDPDNRLVADTLEAEWNARLRECREAREDYERQRVADQKILDQEQMKAIRDLAGDFPRLWNDPSVPNRERKRMVRLLVEDVTLVKTGEQINVHVRFRGGTNRSLVVTAPQNYWKARKTSPEVVRAVDELLEEHTEGAIARILNERGLSSGQGLSFQAEMVRDIRRKYRLRSRRDRLRDRGLLTVDEMAEKLGVSACTVGARRRKGQLAVHRVTDKPEYLYVAPNLQAVGPNNLTRFEVVQAIDLLLEEHTERETSRILNQRGWLSAQGRPFSTKLVAGLRLRRGLASRRERLRRKGMVTAEEAARQLGITAKALLVEAKNSGRVSAHKINERGNYMFKIVSRPPSSGIGGAV